jgi:hypothetical protein
MMPSPAAILERAIDDASLPAGAHPAAQGGGRGLLVALINDLFEVRDHYRRAGQHASGRGKWGRQRAADLAWLASEADLHFSFIFCCRHLELNPEGVRLAYHGGHRPPRTG